MGMRALEVRVHPQFGVQGSGPHWREQVVWVVYNNRTTLLLRILTWRVVKLIFQSLLVPVLCILPD